MALSQTTKSACDLAITLAKSRTRPRILTTASRADMHCDSLFVGYAMQSYIHGLWPDYPGHYRARWPTTVGEVLAVIEYLHFMTRSSLMTFSTVTFTVDAYQATEVGALCEQLFSFKRLEVPIDIRSADIPVSEISQRNELGRIRSNRAFLAREIFAGRLTR